MSGKAPVRLRVSYRSPASLLGELTRSVNKGEVQLPSQREVAVGTRFVFELHASGLDTPVEVLGEVGRVLRLGPESYLLSVRYEAGADRTGVDSALARIFEAHRDEQTRRYPRIPFHLRTQEESADSPTYVVRNISRGGAGLTVAASHMPGHVRPGQPVLLEMWLEDGVLPLHGEVAWVYAPAGGVQGFAPALGIQFGRLRPELTARLDRVLALRALPPPMLRSRLSFGLDAVGRMP
ncbi:MAG: PilZ domain-containing protein [Myxococcaceae bacterium]|nr:PilZ domain-containing protein [Myxococcaceae bacterium]MCI0671958.1 PilZ domain-containing protein [Myxococcaceae bacterium]